LRCATLAGTSACAQTLSERGLFSCRETFQELAAAVYAARARLRSRALPIARAAVRIFTRPRLTNFQNCRALVLAFLMVRLICFLLRTLIMSSPRVSASTLLRKKSKLPPDKKLRCSIWASPTTRSFPGAGVGAVASASSWLGGGVGGIPGAGAGGGQAGRSFPAYLSGKSPRTSPAHCRCSP